MHGADERAPGPSKVIDRPVSGRLETLAPPKGPGMSGASGVHLRRNTRAVAGVIHAQNRSLSLP